MSVVVAGINVPDPMGLPLTVIGPKPNTLEGAPVESIHEIHTEDGLQVGVWEITPDGWSGTWHVRETARKVYAIVPTR